LPSEAERRVTRATLGIEEDAPLLIGGSTHPIEEEQLVEAFVAVLSRHPSTRLLLAPRHIERVEAVEAMVSGRGLAVSTRSAMAAGSANAGVKPQVIILDSRGELALIYQEATVAFVGGTLVPIGGHNLLEPASWGKPVLFGPYTDSWRRQGAADG
jgi:3-deoxy-D-manno-octulosonic-acid transferase